MSSPRAFTTTFEVALSPAAAFATLVSSVRDSLSRWGLNLEPGPSGRVVQQGQEVGRVTSWIPGQALAWEWRPAPWKPEKLARVEFRFDPVPDGTRIVFELHGWGGLLAEDPADLTGWYASEVLAPLLFSISPEGFGEWWTDRRVRRPTGPWARATYGNPVYHWPNFLLILDRIALRHDDHLLEVGCGGGAFLHKALESGCRATAIDHSPEMVRLAREQNEAAVAAGSLTIIEGEAYPLPFSDSTYTCAVMTGVIGFLPDPVAALREIHRTLRPGGRMAIFGATAALRGTPAAPEPFASRIRFFDKYEFEELGREAGFTDVHVEQPDLESYARTAGIPEEGMSLFRGSGSGLLLTGRKG